jgi:hypothetical protein
MSSETGLIRCIIEVTNRSLSDKPLEKRYEY